MKQIAALITAAALMAGPATAQDSSDDISEGMDLLQQGTMLLLQGLMAELAPALSDLEDSISDLNMYHAPEILPNGDIIIRRRQPEADQDVPSDGDVEL